jgi:hypothetical protein
MAIADRAERRRARWLALGVGMLFVAGWMLIYGIPEHAPPSDAHGALQATLLAGVLEINYGVAIPRALYPWAYVFASALAVIGIERMVRGGRYRRAAVITCHVCGAGRGSYRLLGARCPHAHLTARRHEPVIALGLAMAACMLAMVLWSPSP